MVDRPPTDKELTEILAEFRRAGRGRLMTGGALEKLAAEMGLENLESQSPAEPQSEPPAEPGPDQEPEPKPE